MTKLALYEKLEDMIADRQITKAELARQVGVSQVTMTKWCSGRSTPCRDNLIKICRVLDVPVSLFLDDEDPFLLSNNEKDLIDLYRDLSAADKSVLLFFLKQFKKDL